MTIKTYSPSEIDAMFGPPLESSRTKWPWTQTELGYAFFFKMSDYSKDYIPVIPKKVRESGIEFEYSIRPAGADEYYRVMTRIR
jgi:hypothetical protein